MNKKGNKVFTLKVANTKVDVVSHEEGFNISYSLFGREMKEEEAKDLSDAYDKVLFFFRFFGVDLTNDEELRNKFFDI